MIKETFQDKNFGGRIREQLEIGINDGGEFKLRRDLHLSFIQFDMQMLGSSHTQKKAVFIFFLGHFPLVLKDQTYLLELVENVSKSLQKLFTIKK